MGIKLHTPSGIVVAVADQDYFLDTDRNVTTDKHQSAMLLIRKGQNISREMAETYGIPTASTAKAEPEKVAQTDVEDKTETPKKTKKPTPSENKKGAK